MKLIGIIADHPTPKTTLDEVMFTTGASDSHRGGGGAAWSLDEKMGQTYVHRECANTLAQRDYKQPQAVIYELSKCDRSADGE